MSPHAFQRSIVASIQSPFGRLASLTLCAALILAGFPAVTVHAHTGGDRHHSHVADVAADHDADPSGQPDSSDFQGSGVLHVHDAGVGATTLPTSSDAMLVFQMSQAPNACILTSPPSEAHSAPPHRPPIA